MNQQEQLEKKISKLQKQATSLKRKKNENHKKVGKLLQEKIEILKEKKLELENQFN